MQKKLTITIDEEVYEGLHQIIGPRRISRFIETLVRPHVLQPDLEQAYQRMAQDEKREAEAIEWAEGTIEDNAHLGGDHIQYQSNAVDATSRIPISDFQAICLRISVLWQHRSIGCATDHVR